MDHLWTQDIFHGPFYGPEIYLALARARAHIYLGYTQFMGHNPFRVT
jgi:hypothetical protein